MTHDHDHSDGHEHGHDHGDDHGDDAAWEVKELSEEEVNALLAEGKLVQVEGPEGQALYIETEAFVEGVRLDLAENADNAPYLVGVGGLLLEGDHLDLAHAAVELALAADPASVDGLLLAGIVEARLGRLDTALERLDAHLVQAPTSALGQTHRAHVLLGLGRGDEGHAAARRALALDPNDVGAIQALVAGDDGTAEALARTKALAGELKGWGVLRVAGDLAVSLGDDTSAIAYWKQAVDLGADDSTIANLLAQLGQSGRIDELVEIADGLSRLSDRDPSLRWNVAAGYEAAGRDGEARIVFASIAHDPNAAADVRSAAQGRLDAD
jgi:tetratricopeptide (TPR) repeat protein